MKKIRQLNLSTEQLLTCDEQNAIVAGVRECRKNNGILERIGRCDCSYPNKLFHTEILMYYYYATQDEEKQAAILDIAADMARDSKNYDLANKLERDVDYLTMTEEEQYGVEVFAAKIDLKTLSCNGQHIEPPTFIPTPKSYQY